MLHGSGFHWLSPPFSTGWLEMNQYGGTLLSRVGINGKGAHS